MRLQLLFESVIDENGKEIIIFCPNWDILPNHKEIDTIIGRLDRLKNEMTDDEINNHNSEIFEREKREMYGYSCNETKKEKKKENGYIYLLKSLDIYKIGRAKSLDGRIKAYKTENPHGIEILHQKLVEDYVGTETKLLLRFKNKQVRGEWFKLSREDVEWIKNNI